MANKKTGYEEHLDRLAYCRQKRAEQEALWAGQGDSIFKMLRRFYYSEGSAYYLVSRAARRAQYENPERCRIWAEEEIFSRGITLTVDLYEDGPIFAYISRKIGPKEFGPVVKEWEKPEFIMQLLESFTQTVNDELRTRGLSGHYNA